MTWPVFLGVCGAMLAFGLAVILRAEANERRWKRQKEAEQDAHHSPAE
jgi:hypothetical protein